MHTSSPIPTLSLSDIFLEAHLAHNLEPVADLFLSCFISEAHKAHTSSPIPTLSLSYFFLEAHKAHNPEPVAALSLSCFVLLSGVMAVRLMRLKNEAEQREGRSQS